MNTSRARLKHDYYAASISFVPGASGGRLCSIRALQVWRRCGRDVINIIHACPTTNRSDTQSWPQRDVSRVAASQLSALLVGRISFKHRNLDAGSRARLAGSATIELAFLARL